MFSSSCQQENKQVSQNVKHFPAIYFFSFSLLFSRKKSAYCVVTLRKNYGCTVYCKWIESAIWPCAVPKSQELQFSFDVYQRCCTFLNIVDLPPVSSSSSSSSSVSLLFFAPLLSSHLCFHLFLSPGHSQPPPTLSDAVIFLLSSLRLSTPQRSEAVGLTGTRELEKKKCTTPQTVLKPVISYCEFAQGEMVGIDNFFSLCIFPSSSPQSACQQTGDKMTTLAIHSQFKTAVPVSSLTAVQWLTFIASVVLSWKILACAGSDICVFPQISSIRYSAAWSVHVRMRPFNQSWESIII